MTIYEKRLAKIQKRDLTTYLYHKAHPEAKLCNARDRKAGYTSRQAVWAAIQRVERRLQADRKDGEHNGIAGRLSSN